MATELKEFRASNDAIRDAEELRNRIREDGYLFFRRLHDPDMLRALRLEILGVLRDCGWIRSDAELFDGVADVSRRCAEGDVGYAEIYHHAYRLESFHRAGHWPSVVNVMEKIVGGEVLPHPNKIARLWFPQYVEHTTPVHQDFVHFQGSYDTYTCWSPVGDCPIELGGLAVQPGSHKRNTVFDHHFSLGAGSLTVDTDEHQGDWVTTDYEMGDALIFHSLTLHQALPNVTEDRLRVSLDNRYQALDVPIAEQMLAPHLSAHSALTWEQVYEGWKSTDLQYYWEKLDLEVAPRDGSYSEKGFADALVLAGEGDARAELHLKRTIQRDPESEQAKAASEVLQRLHAGANGNGAAALD